MAAATISKKNSIVGATRDVITEMQVSSMTSDQIETISHGGPDGVYPYKVELDVIVEPVSGPVTMAWIRASDDATNNTSNLRFSVPAGGDITSAVGLVRFYFKHSKSDGLVTASSPPAPR